jgi:DNA-binding NarL/FixJ family response regulator
MFGGIRAAAAAATTSRRQEVIFNMLTKTLTSREEQIARCVATGLRNKEIATTLFISEKTVKNHLWSIFHKTGTKDRLEVALWMVSRVQGVGNEDERRSVIALLRSFC